MGRQYCSECGDTIGLQDQLPDVPVGLCRKCEQGVGRETAMSEDYDGCILDTVICDHCCRGCPYGWQEEVEEDEMEGNEG